MEKERAIQYAAEFVDSVKESGFAVALTGAGVSTASGIPDFRGPTGLYSVVSQRTFELDFMLSNPAQYYETAVEYIHTLADKEPNVTHYMLAELERKGMLNGVITQNIDGLHQKAGSENVVEFHGNVSDFHCCKCFAEYSRAQVEEKICSDRIPYCACGSLIRPGVVFFGDPIPVDAIRRSQRLAAKSEVFVTLGSSLVVNPAATIPVDAKYGGAKLFIVNIGSTPLDRMADRCYEIELEMFSEAVIELIKN